ncbi:MAG: sugar phosphate isomerase/epimerase family protein [Candidatus Bathyarchaeia archaeon]
MAKPEIGLSMLHCLGDSFKEMLKKLCKTELSHIELVDEGLHMLNERRVQALREMASSYGFKYSVHAPFADINIASPSKSMLKATLKRLEKSIAHASTLNARVWVFHPGLKTGVSMFYPGFDWLQNCRTAKLLSKIAGDYGVDIAIENVPEPYPFLLKSVEHFAKFYEEINEDIGLVLDVGHSNLNGQTESFLKNFADKIVHIHVSDNDGRDDQHLGVGYGTVDWQEVAGLLKHIGYNKVIVVESIEHVEESILRLKQTLA